MKKRSYSSNTVETSTKKVMLDRKSCDPGWTPQGTQTSKANDSSA